jgi:hypothetical protein
VIRPGYESGATPASELPPPTVGVKPAPPPLPREVEFVYGVVMDEGGLFGIYVELTRAMNAARAINGIVCPLPVLADYRTGVPGGGGE